MKTVPIERSGDFIVTMYDLEEEACVQLLQRCTFGRVGLNDDTEGVTILPVNCLFSRGALLFRTSLGSPLDHLRDGRQVAFEADHVDPATESGWSVLIRGRASLVTEPDRLTVLADSAVHPWAPAHRDLWIEILPDRITGRIIRRQRQYGSDAQLSYMRPG